MNKPDVIKISGFLLNTQIRYTIPMPTLSKNKKALFDYHILEKYEDGIVLTGWPVFNLADVYILAGALWAGIIFVFHNKHAAE